MTTNIQGSTGVVLVRGNARVNQNISSHGGHPVGSIDLAKLSMELDRLYAGMNVRRREQDHDLAVAEIVRAKRAATEGNSTELTKCLKAAGSWALGIAKELTLSVAEKAIEQSIFS